MHCSVCYSQIIIVKPVLNKIVFRAEDLVGPLEHICTEFHFIHRIFDFEAQSVRNVLFGVNVFSVDQLGSV